MKSLNIMLYLDVKFIMPRLFVRVCWGQRDIDHVPSPYFPPRRVGDMLLRLGNKRPDMPRPTLVLDGLWYSLCPAFTPRSLNPTLALLRRKKHSSNSRSFAPPVSCVGANRPRQYHSGNGNDNGRVASTQIPFSPRIAIPNDTPTSASPSEPGSLSTDLEEHHSTPDILDETREKELHRQFKRAGKVPGVLESLPTSFLERKLQEEMAERPSIPRAMHFLEVLIRDRQVRPTARHYKALILANCDAKYGSYLAVQLLLEEMKENDIALDSGTLHAAIQTLAVHPNYILRVQVLDQLRDRWLTLSPAGWHFVVAGLVRERQFEMAFDHLEMMERKHIPIENWLHSLVIYHLCEYKAVDEVYRLVRRWVEQGHDMTEQLWSHMLCKAGEHRHLGLTCYVWERRVNLGYLHPSQDTCSDALRVAAKFGDHKLGQAVFRYYQNSGIEPGPGDYDRLIKSLLINGSDGDLFAAFEALCTMHEAGVQPRDTTLNLFYTYLVTGHIDRLEAWNMLKRLKNAKRTIHIGAVEAIAEAWKHGARSAPALVDEALNCYRELYTLCPEGASVKVYNSLINMCRRAQNLGSGMFLVKEMASLGVVPNNATFDFIIQMCLDAGNFRSAWMYLQDMLKRDFAPTQRTRQYTQEVCAKSLDEYSLKLQYHPSLQPTSQPTPEPVKPAKPAKREWVEWTKGPKPSKNTRRRRRRMKAEREAEREARREAAKEKQGIALSALSGLFSDKVSFGDK
ncbi:hypothetical protein N7532_000686 [Penicillium argentinense]|uniref:Pentatricopeptide repeat-containing protein-mitochondrial domain-containing protein n=1 Tax=Penicillium argentinense TaxID=1131581 RepID=A0A9W9G5Y0_9EURO|nr:uncharacterized protein N7532_000686 [Penicillium argentinense]KAJ5112641.1 hypothetical protein N7532_000686 [Penicillium argentinense]